MLEFSYEHDGICKGCDIGMNTKKYFPNSSNKSKTILDVIHSDICGPMTSPSMSGGLYYVIFIDDCSHKSWIYFLKTKNETLDKLK